MSSRLDSKPQIWKLASDLGLSISDSPTRSIVQLVARRVRRISKDFHCKTLRDLLTATAAGVETVFEEIHSDSDLYEIRTKYLNKGEKGFAILESDLQGSDDYAITIRRVNREKWEPQFVSVIDCRGDKVFRTYFSKWHELAHLLTLTPQLRLVFRRTHSGCAARDPEEMLMDVIAGDIGFLQDFVHSGIEADVSFETIRRIKEECCPDASVQAATIGIVKALPVPCILVEAKMALRKCQTSDAAQMRPGVDGATPTPALRAVHVTVNGAARDAGIQFHKNWRVPADSVTSRVFAEGGYSESLEDLSWWITSDGGSLDPCPVLVKAKKVWDSVQALIIPQV
jgi:hypothetical protein